MNVLVFLVSLFPILGIFIAPKKFSAKKSGHSQIECELGLSEVGHNLTLVTALYDIQRERWPNFSRKATQYHQEMQNVLRLPIPMVIFTDSKNYAYVGNTRREFDLEHLTWVRLLPYQKLPMHSHRRIIKKIQEDELNNENKWNSDWDSVMKTTPEVFSPDYIVLVNSKPDFLNMALEENHFCTEFFAWIDAGFSRLEPEKWTRSGAYDWYPTFPNNKITMLKRTTKADKVSRYQLKDLYHKDIPEIINAGLIAGDRISIAQFHNYFYQEVQNLLNQDMIEDEQVIFVILAGKHPELFYLLERDCGADLNTVKDHCLTQGDVFELLSH